jgi:hypothetical protein
MLYATCVGDPSSFLEDLSPLHPNLNDRRWRQRIDTPDRLPDDSVQFGFRGTIRMAKVPPRRFLCAGRIWTIHLDKRDARLKRRVRGKHKLRFKIHEKALRSIVEKCKAPHSKDLLHGLQGGSSLKVLVLDHVAAGERRNREQDGAAHLRDQGRPGHRLPKQRSRCVARSGCVKWFRQSAPRQDHCRRPCPEESDSPAESRRCGRLAGE